MWDQQSTISLQFKRGVTLRLTANTSVRVRQTDSQTVENKQRSTPLTDAIFHKTQLHASVVG